MSRKGSASWLTSSSIAPKPSIVNRRGQAFSIQAEDVELGELQALKGTAPIVLQPQAAGTNNEAQSNLDISGDLSMVLGNVCFSASLQPWALLQECRLALGRACQTDQLITVSLPSIAKSKASLNLECGAHVITQKMIGRMFPFPAQPLLVISAKLNGIGA